jgi:hypothetical protein
LVVTSDGEADHDAEVKGREYSRGDAGELKGVGD